MSTPEEQFLMGGGGPPSAFTKYDPPGTTVTGTITEKPELRQQTDPKDSSLKFWDDGKPMMQLIVVIQTTKRDNPDDDGLRRLYVKGRLQKAVKEAVAKAGASFLEIGGTLSVTFTHEDEPKNKVLSGAKNYTAQYTLAAQNFLADEQAPAAPPAPPAAPTPAQAPAAATPPVDADAVKAALANLTPEQLASLGVGTK